MTYICIYVTMRSTSKCLLCVCLLQFACMLCTLLHTWTVWLREKMAAVRKRLKFSLQSTSNDIEWNESSSPTLPTFNDIRCEIGNTSDYYSCTVMRCSFRTHFKGAGWSTAIKCKLLLCADIRGIGCRVWARTHFKRAGWSTAIRCILLLRADIWGMGCCVWARTHFKSAGWSTAIGFKLLLCAGTGTVSIGFMVLEWQLDIACAGCSHLLVIVATASAYAVHLSSITIFGASLSEPHLARC